MSPSLLKSSGLNPCRGGTTDFLGASRAKRRPSAPLSQERPGEKAITRKGAGAGNSRSPLVRPPLRAKALTRRETVPSLSRLSGGGYSAREPRCRKVEVRVAAGERDIRCNEVAG